MDGYDPRSDGALCNRCSLYRKDDNWFPVPSELRSNALITIVAEAPGVNEVNLARPLVGVSGNEVFAAFRAAGWSREHTSLTNCCLCRPKANDMKAHQALVRKRNKNRLKNGKPLLIEPVEACWPRLLKELHQARALLLMGAYARSIVYRNREMTREEEALSRAKAKKEGDTSLMVQRGYPDTITLPGYDIFPPRTLPVISTVHAAFALRRRRWTIPFRWDIAKATRLATGTLRPMNPAVYLFPRNDQLANFLNSLEGTVAYDIETDMDGDWAGERNLRCIGFGNSSRAIVVPYRKVPRERCPEWSYDAFQAEERDRIVLDWFARDGVAVDQNGQFDQCVLRAHFGDRFVMNRKRFDTAIAHHVSWSEFPHDLGFMVSQYTDRPSHKDVNHSAWPSDRELHHYCGFDCSTEAWNADCLASEPHLLAQKEVFANDMFLSDFCREMTELGMQMDLFERDSHFKTLTESAEVNLAKAQALAVEAVHEEGFTQARVRFAGSINPNSNQQMGTFLYDMAGITPLPAKEGGYTDTGEPSVSKDVLFALIDRGLSPTIEQFLLAVIDCREDIKLRGTYCEVEPCYDGRIHPTWNPHVVLSGRLSCSGPNLQNLKKLLRTIYACLRGHVLVAWDYAQIEARITAWLARQFDQIDAFLAGADIHRVNACAVMGIASPEEVNKEERQFTKTFVYAAQYLAGERKVWQMIRNFRARDGSRPYRDMPFKEVDVMFSRFWKQRGAIEQFHARNRSLQREQGYLEDAIMGRRRYFLDAIELLDEKEEKANYIIQSTASAVVNKATRRLREKYPPGFAGKYTGIVHQGHDSLMIECPEHMAAEVAVTGQKILYDELGDMPLPVDIGIGYSFGSLVEYETTTDGQLRVAQ